MKSIFLLSLMPLAAAASDPDRPASHVTASTLGFDSLWTAWDVANRAAMHAEVEALRQVQRDVAAADAQRLQQLHNEGRPLGERVGEIVRAGDCRDGERVARQAGDFALVEAVRAHCRRTSDAVLR